METKALIRLYYKPMP